MSETEQRQRKRGNRIPVEDYVYCLDHGDVHADTTNPHDYFGNELVGDGGDKCRESEHRRLVWYTKEGDWA